MSSRLERRRRGARRRWLAAAAAPLALSLIAAAVGIAVWSSSGGAQHGHRLTSVRRAHNPTTSTAPATTAAPTTTTIPPPPAVAPRVDHIVTNDPVVFITIDDGWHPLPDVFAFLQARGAPVTAFLIAPIGARDADFYRQVVTLGGTVEDHTMHHRDLSKLSPDQQSAELCQAADLLGTTFGRRPTFARPPYGTENQSTDQVVGSCGMYATALWSAKYSNHELATAHPGGLRAGDIILMHWGPGLLQDLQDLFPRLDAAGLRPAPLQDYVGPTAKYANTLPPPPTGPLAE